MSKYIHQNYPSLTRIFFPFKFMNTSFLLIIKFLQKNLKIYLLWHFYSTFLPFQKNVNVSTEEILKSAFFLFLRHVNILSIVLFIIFFSVLSFFPFFIILKNKLEIKSFLEDLDIKFTILLKNVSLKRWLLKTLLVRFFIEGFSMHGRLEL